MERRKGKALALLMAGVVAKAVATQTGLSKRTVDRIRAAHKDQIETGVTNGEVVTQKRLHQTIVEAESNWMDDAAEQFQGMATDAMDRLKEMVQKPKPGEEPPHPVRFQACKYILDRIMPSADAKVGARATEKAGDAYAQALDRALTVDPEQEERLIGTRKVFRDVVEKRQPLIQYRGEATAASIAANEVTKTGGNGKVTGNGKARKGETK